MAVHDPAADTDLIKRAQAEDLDAFCTLADRYARRIYLLASYYCRNAQDAEDLSQEVWLKAYQALGSFRFDSSFYTWQRRITINAFPTDAFFRDAGRAGADPRKGLWHPAVALVCRLSHTDPLPAWRALAVLLAPLFVLNAAAFAALFGGGFAAAVGAWGLLLTYGGGLSTQYLREAVFATKLADQLALATLGAVLVDLERGSARTRAAVIGLALGTVAVHVFGAIQFAITFGALGVGLLLRDRGASPAFRRLAITSARAAGAALPSLLGRAPRGFATVNSIHTEPQGLLELARSEEHTPELQSR